MSFRFGPISFVFIINFYKKSLLEALILQSVSSFYQNYFKDVAPHKRHVQTQLLYFRSSMIVC